MRRREVLCNQGGKSVWSCVPQNVAVRLARVDNLGECTLRVGLDEDPLRKPVMRPDDRSERDFGLHFDVELYGVVL